MVTDDNAATSSGRPRVDLSRSALRVYSGLLRSLLDAIDEPMVVIDEGGEVLLYNRPFDELAGLGPEDRLKMTNVHAVFAMLGATLGDSQLAELLESSGTPQMVELRGERTVRCRVAPLTLEEPGDCRMIAFREVTVERRDIQELEHRALHDQLTGLANRDLLLDRLGSALSRQAREGGGVGVMFLDLDRFKEINDRHGHAAGDLVLVEIADRLHHALREADSIGRFGGDEFVVVCDGLDDEAALARICARVQDGIARPYQLGPKAGTLSTSLGAVLEWDHGVLPLQLIERADALMYAAKRRGSHREILVHGRPGELTLRARSASALREAFEAGQLNLAYLPIIALESQETMMVEGLLRCQRAALSKLTPAELLELVEQTRLANRLDEWVLGGAAHGARLLREATGAPMRVVVNLSASQLANDTLPKLVADAARAHEIETRSLGFDIAERVIATNAPWLEPAIESLRALDSALFADDVLTPDVDVERFAALGFAGLKLDGSMIERSADDANFAARVQAMVRLTRSLGLFVIAERVEDERRLETARNLGCDMAQGYGFFGFPRPASELAKLIR